MPEITLVTTTSPFESSGHSWIVTACSGMSIGQKGMIYASQALALTKVDLFENEELRKDIRNEFNRRKGTDVWKAILTEGPPPIK